MKLIIDIDEKIYNDLRNRGLTGMLTTKECECMNEAIYNGTPLEEALENQKTGHWIRWYEEVEYKTCTENIPHCKCSECNKEYNPYTSNFIKYCPQCGVKMEEENKE